MKKMTSSIKFGLDLIIGVTFALFFNKNVLGGLAFNEIAGLVICGAFLAHVLLNGKWVKNVTIKLFDRKLPWKTRISYCLNVLLLLTMTTIVVTGILISRVVFPDLTIGNEQSMKMLHLSVSYLTLILVAIHVGLHWQWVMNMFKKTFRIKSSTTSLGYVAKIVTVLTLLFGLYEIYSTGFGNRVVQSAGIFSTSSEQGKMGNGQFSQGGQPPEGFNGERPTPPNGDFSDSGERPTPPNGDFVDNGEGPTSSAGDFAGNGEKPTLDGKTRGEHGGNSNVISVLLTYFSIMSVFVIITHYLGKVKIRRKSKTRAVI